MISIVLYIYLAKRMETHIEEERRTKNDINGFSNLEFSKEKFQPCKERQTKA
jgi:hypothetical protein